MIQTIGRAARHLNGRAILYADVRTKSMEKAIGETERRREKQIAFNLANGITPRGVVKGIKDLIDGATSDKAQKAAKAHEASQNDLLRSHTLELSEKDLAKEIKRLEKLMLQHAQNLEFEKAARVRDQLSLLRQQVFGGG